MTTTSNLPFSPSSAPLGAHGAPVCMHETANVLLRRSDNIRRPRAFINAGKIKDESGNTVSEQRRFTPGTHLDEGVDLTVIQGERKAEAIHLPPPVIINLREAAPASEDLLTDEQLDYFQANGNNALIYMHGYNVPHGEWGRFLNRKATRKRYGGHGPAPTNVWHPNKATTWQDAEALSDNSATPLKDDQLNGTGAHNWATRRCRQRTYQ